MVLPICIRVATYNSILDSVFVLNAEVRIAHPEHQRSLCNKNVVISTARRPELTGRSWGSKLQSEEQSMSSVLQHVVPR
jgi:hypothetical protein